MDGFNVNRTISLDMKLNLFFGGIFNQFGWLMLGFCLIPFWIFVLNADLSFIHYSTRKTVETQGLGMGSFEAALEINEKQVYENHYKFTGPYGQIFEDLSYSTGGFPVKAGQKLTIEYPEGRPKYSRIKGMTRELFGPWALTVGFFPLIGLIFILIGAKRAARFHSLLKRGLMAKPGLVSKEETNLKINNQPVFELTWMYKDFSGAEQTFSNRTHDRKVLESEEEPSLLYFRDKPEKAVLVGSLPGRPGFDPAGQVVTAEDKPIKRLIIPGLSIIGHGLYLFFKFAA